MATVTNISLNTGSVTNNALSGTSRQWKDQDYTWADASGNWDNPYKFVNNDITTGSITNNSLS